MTEFTHIRISWNTKAHLNQFRATGQSYEGLIRELLGMAYQAKGFRRADPVLPLLPDEYESDPKYQSPPSFTRVRCEGLTRERMTEMTRQRVTKLERR